MAVTPTDPRPEPSSQPGAATGSGNHDTPVIPGSDPSASASTSDSTSTSTSTSTTTTTTTTTHPRQWLILAVLCMSVFMVVVDNTIVNVALPTLSSELNANTTALQWIVDAYALVFASLLLFGGSLGDRFGRKGMLQAGLVLFAATSVMAGLSSTSGQLIASRAAMGVGAALVFPATLAILINVFTQPTERAKAIGVWSAVSGLAVALGPLTGGALLERYAWGSIFFVNIPVVAIALVAGAILLPSSRDHRAGRFDPVGVLLSIGGIGAIVWGLIEGPALGWTSPAVLGALIAGVVLMVVFVRWELNRTDPMLEVRMFTNPRFSAAAVSISIAFFALFGFIFLITQYFQLVRGYSTLNAGVATLPFALGAGISAPLSARAALRFGTKRVVATGLGSMAMGFLIISRIGPDTAYWGPLVVSMVLMGAGLTMTTAPATEAIMGELPRGKAGVGSAVNDTTREIGGTFGVAVLGSVFISVFRPRITEALSGLPIPAEALEAARGSIGAALAVAEQAPAEGRAIIIESARSAFMDGLHVSVLVAAAAAIIGVVLAIRYLPNRAG